MAEPRRRLGVRARVVAAFLVLLLGAEVVSLVVLRQVGERRIAQQADRDLADAAADLRSRLVDELAGRGDGAGVTAANLGGVFEDHLRSRPPRSDEAALTFVDGRPFVASAGAPIALRNLPIAAEWATIRDSASGQVSTRAGPARWVAVPVQAGGRVVGVYVAVAFLRDQQAALRGTLVTVSIVTGLVLVGAALVAWGLAGRALAPVRDLAATARSVSGGDDLGARIEVESRDEVGDLAVSFNGMLDDLQRAFDSQRLFLDGAAHELRTPITIVRGHLELLDDDDPEQRAADVALVLDEVDRMERLVTDLRVLARSERPDFLSLQTVAVADLVTAIGKKVAAMGPREWVVTCPGVTSHVRADPHRLTQAVVALVHNAVEVTTDGDRIEVGAREAGRLPGDEVVIWVTDSGPGIAAEHLPTLFARSGRTVTRRPGGTGLGLPIAGAIVAAHRGRIEVRSEVGVGTTFELHLPTLPT